VSGEVENKIQALIFRFQRLANKVQLVSQSVDVLVEEVGVLGNVLNDFINDVRRMKAELEEAKKLKEKNKA